MTKPHPSTRGRHSGRTSASALRPAHDLRAWALFFLVGTMLLATVPLAGSAGAQLPDLPVPIPGSSETEDPEPTPSPSETEEESPIPALPGGDEEPPAEGGGVKTAFYTSPTSALTPGTLTDSTIQCIVIPESCTPDAQAITGPVLGGVVAGLEGLDTATEPVPQPVPPGALPVGLLNGNQRYSSAVQIGPPTVAEGKTVSDYTISFQMSSASFAVESPAFREFVLAVVAQAGTGGPEMFETFFGNVTAGETDLLTQNITGLEACVIAEPWEAGDNQPVREQPEIDIFYCSPRAEPDDNNIVTFDMTFPAQDALTDDEQFKLDWSNGILIRPLAAQNLAYGDADYSTNYYAYLEPLDANPPTTEFTQVDKPEPIPVSPGNNTNTGGSTGGSTSGSSGSSGSTGGTSGGRGSSSSSSSGSSSSNRPSSPAASGTTSTTAAQPAPAAESGVTSAVQDNTSSVADEAFAPVNEESAGSFPIAWILLPMMLGGAFWYGRVLDGAPVTAAVRSGAMTRLLRDRGFQI